MPFKPGDILTVSDETFMYVEPLLNSDPINVSAGTTLTMLGAIRCVEPSTIFFDVMWYAMLAGHRLVYMPLGDKEVELVIAGNGESFSLTRIDESE